MALPGLFTGVGPCMMQSPGVTEIRTVGTATRRAIGQTGRQVIASAADTAAGMRADMSV